MAVRKKHRKKHTFAVSALLALLIVGGFAALLGLFALGLNNNPHALDLAIKGQKIPPFSLPSLTTARTVNHSDLDGNGKHYYLLNVWATWCPECYKEHAYLHQLSHSETLYGMNWRDQRNKAQDFLQRLGNPYRHVFEDAHSELAIGLGVAGAPETFLIRRDGTILYRHAGVLNARVWQAEFVPMIEKIEEKNENNQ